MADGIQIEGTQQPLSRSVEDVVQRPGGESGIDMVMEAPVNRTPQSPVQKGSGESGIDMANEGAPLNFNPMTPYGPPDHTVVKPWVR